MGDFLDTVTLQL